MTKRQLKAAYKELKQQLDDTVQNLQVSNEVLRQANKKLEEFAYEGTIGPVDGDKLLALLVSVSIKFDGKVCSVDTLLNHIIDILPRYKLEEGSEK